MDSSIPVVKFLFRNNWQILSDSLKSNPLYEVEDFNVPNDLATYLSGQEAVLIIVSLMDKDDLIGIATFVKLQKKIAKDSIAKLVVINFSGDKILERSLAKLGIQDVIDPTISTRALRFKIDFWMKSLTAQVKQVQKSAPQNQKTNQAHNTAESKSSETSLNWEEPLVCEDDIWLIKNESDCKRVLSKWLVKIVGPGPYAGQWNEVPGKSNLWQFEVMGDLRNLLISGNGHWYFTGYQKPEFVWKENVWQMAGSEFNLYYEEGGSTLSRLNLKDKKMSICRNSDYANTKESIITKSFDKDFVFKKENSQSEQDDVENETDRFKNLEGKGKTDHLQHGPLKGKVDGTDSKSTTESGPASPQLNSGKELSLKSHNLENQAAELNLKKSSNETSNNKGNAFNDRISSHYKNSSENHNGVEKDNYQGESSTDKLSTRYHSQTNEKSDIENEDFSLAFKNAMESAKVTAVIGSGLQNVFCTLDDYFDQSIIFVTGDNGLRKASKVDLDLSFLYLKEETKLKFKGIVSNIESDDDGQNYITVDLNQENVKDFESFMKLYQERQSNIELFMKQAKGL